MYCGGADRKITSMKGGTHQKYWSSLANILICIVQNLFLKKKAEVRI